MLTNVFLILFGSGPLHRPREQHGARAFPLPRGLKTDSKVQWSWQRHLAVDCPRYRNSVDTLGFEACHPW
jgi:hypothetical protein